MLITATLDAIVDIQNHLVSIEKRLRQISALIDPPGPYPIRPVGSLIDQAILEVPPEFQVGRSVFFNHDPLKRLVPITLLGSAVIQVQLTLELASWLNFDGNSDLLLFVYPSAVTLSDAP